MNSASGQVVGRVVVRDIIIRSGGNEKRSKVAELVQKLIIEKRKLEDVKMTSNTLLPVGDWIEGVPRKNPVSKTRDDGEYPERFRFLESLAGSIIISFRTIKINAFQGATRQYVAFVIETKSPLSIL